MNQPISSRNNRITSENPQPKKQEPWAYICAHVYLQARQNSPESQVQFYDIIWEGHIYICFWFVSHLKMPTLTMYSIIRQFFQCGVLVLLYTICLEDKLTFWVMKNIPPRGSGLGRADFGCANFPILHLTWPEPGHPWERALTPGEASFFLTRWWRGAGGRGEGRRPTLAGPLPSKGPRGGGLPKGTEGSETGEHMFCSFWTQAQNGERKS